MPREGSPSPVDAGGPRLGERSSGAPCRMRHPSAAGSRDQEQGSLGSSLGKPCVVRSPVSRCADDTPTWLLGDLAQHFSYSSWRCHQTPVSLRPWGRGRATGTCPKGIQSARIGGIGVVDDVRDRRAGWTPRSVVGPEHEVVDEELRASAEEVCQRGVPLIDRESVLLVDPTHGSS
jgi:hypothetical protein